MSGTHFYPDALALYLLQSCQAALKSQLMCHCYVLLWIRGNTFQSRAVSCFLDSSSIPVAISPGICSSIHVDYFVDANCHLVAE